MDAAGSTDIQNAIENIATPASAAGLVSLIVFFWAASGMMGALRKGLVAATGVVQGRPIVRAKLVDFALIVGATLFVLVSVAIGLVAELASEVVAHLSSALGINTVVEGKGIALALAFLLWIVTSLLLYRFVPAAGLRLQDALAGAIVTAIILLGISLASDLVYAHTDRLECHLRLADEPAHLPLLRLPVRGDAAPRSRGCRRSGHVRMRPPASP